jgi:hypothetical protein
VDDLREQNQQISCDKDGVRWKIKVLNLPDIINQWRLTPHLDLDSNNNFRLGQVVIPLCQLHNGMIFADSNKTRWELSNFYVFVEYEDLVEKVVNGENVSFMKHVDDYYPNYSYDHPQCGRYTIPVDILRQENQEFSCDNKEVRLKITIRNLRKILPPVVFNDKKMKRHKGKWVMYHDQDYFVSRIPHGALHNDMIFTNSYGDRLQLQGFPDEVDVSFSKLEMVDGGGHQYTNQYGVKYIIPDIFPAEGSVWSAENCWQKIRIIDAGAGFDLGEQGFLEL